MPMLPDLTGSTLVIWEVIYALGILVMFRQSGIHWKRERKIVQAITGTTHCLDSQLIMTKVACPLTIGSMP